MFSKKIVETDLFMEMSPTAKLLYFYLNMSADDDGFVGNPKTIKLISGATDDDLKILIAKQFIIPFESGVVVIKDWKIHNYIQKDRYNPTQYLDEKKQLLVEENGTYTKCIQDVYSLDTQVRLGKSKDRLGKSNNMSDKSDDVIPYSEILEYLNKKTGRSFRNVEANKKLIKARWNEGYKLEDFKTVVDNMVSNWSGKMFNGVPAENYLQPKTLFSNKFDSYLNQVPTIYTEEKMLLSLDSKGSYLLGNQVSTIPQPNDNQMSAQDRIGEVRLGKDSIGKDSIDASQPNAFQEKSSGEDINSLLSEYLDSFIEFSSKNIAKRAMAQVEFMKLSSEEKKQAVIGAKNYFEWYKQENPEDKTKKFSINSYVFLESATFKSFQQKVKVKKETLGGLI